MDRDRLTKKFLELKGKTIVCPSCIFAKVKHRAWGGHGDHGFIRKPTQVNLGGGTSIDQIISVRVGRVPRMDGRYIRSRIHCGTVFMDHVSTNSFTHLQYSTSGIETITAKRSYELYADSFEVIIRSYHADNGIFAEKDFRDEINESNQKISFCAVGVHRKNVS